VKRGASIGANATVLCGITIGAYAFIAAGAVATRDIPDFAMMLGNPARQRGFMCRCGVKLPAAEGVVRCAACGTEYVSHDARLALTAPGR
jgi:UDP-2-acetamido-3-amino-2,3-dideoxy-glucuronate N-acetyltransferase